MAIIEKLREYILCIIFHTLLPVLPIILERWITGSISSQSLLISAAIYSIMIGNDSKDKLIFGVSILAGIIFAVAFGAIAAVDSNTQAIMNAISPYDYETNVIDIIKETHENRDLLYVEESAFTAIVALFLVSLVEKYRIHIIEGERYWKH